MFGSDILYSNVLVRISLTNMLQYKKHYACDIDHYAFVKVRN